MVMDDSSLAARLPPDHKDSFLPGNTASAEVVEHLGVRLDCYRHRVSVGTVLVTLTATEFRLLDCLIRHPGRVFTRSQLMEAGIGGGALVLERTIDVHIKSLRRKLSRPDLIETVRGMGYRFRTAAVETDAPSSLPASRNA
jgi:two-component system phosphate regulon response regulator PhoB